MTDLVTIDGLDDVHAMFERLTDTTAIKKALLNGALMVEGDAKLSIQHGSHTGRTYGHHQASAPGEAPATDTGLLASSIQHWPDEDGLSIDVGSQLDYAVDLEYGTRNMAARPFIQPALDKNQQQIIDNVVAAIGAPT